MARVTVHNLNQEARAPPGLGSDATGQSAGEKARRMLAEALRWEPGPVGGVGLAAPRVGSICRFSPARAKPW